MINIAIWETEEISVKVKTLLECDYNAAIQEIGAEPLKPIAYVKSDGVPSDNSDLPIISISSFIKSYKEGSIAILVIPIDVFNGNNGLILYLIESGVDIQNIYLFDKLCNFKSENVIDAINPYISKDYLPYLEYHLADHCNLNCKGCEHYSSLVREPVFPDFEDLKLGFTKLKQLISHIGTIRLLGGEPLLNPDICLYMDFTRQLYPDSDIYVVTNGSLLTRMNQDFYDCLVKNNIIIYISQYKPFLNQINDIKDYLNNKKAKYVISDYVEYFGIRQKKEKGNSMSYFYRCLQARCNFIYGHQIGACYMPFLTKYFNNYFENQLEEPLPEDGSIDLLDPQLTTELLKIRLLMPFERCRYCTTAKRINWEIIGKDSKLEDWVI